MSSNRRNFIKQLGSTAAIITAGSLQSLGAVEEHKYKILTKEKKYSSNDTIRIAAVGMGIMGFNDVNTAIKVPGIELVGCCDLYNGRLERVKEVYGQHVFTTKRYQELLERKDIDAIIVATSDNWHSRICIDALHSGKAVYSEKPMVHKIGQGWDVIKAQQDTKKVMQVGSQRISSVVFAKAKELYQGGAIGQINSVEAYFNRQSALGAWQYTMPTDSSIETVDWEAYQLYADEKHAFDEKRFFWWRNYREYGTGVAGDLFVHLLTGLHFITGSKGPSKIYAVGGLTFWKDGRNVPDVMTAVLEYGECAEHAAFQVSLRVNFVSGEGETGGTKITGTEGVLEMGDNSFTIKRSKMSKAPGIGGWDSLETYPAKMQKELMDAYNKKYSKSDQASPSLPDITYQAPDNYDEHLEHFSNFFESIRTGKPAVEDAVFGFRAAAPCLACNESFFTNKVIHWDAENMKVIE